MSEPVQTWENVLEQRRQLAKALIDPLSDEEKNLLQYLLQLELENRHLAQPPILPPLLRYLEEHFS